MLALVLIIPVLNKLLVIMIVPIIISRAAAIAMTVFQPILVIKHVLPIAKLQRAAVACLRMAQDHGATEVLIHKRQIQRLAPGPRLNLRPM